MDEATIRVAVAGALGRMGRVACAALRSTDGFAYAGGFARTRVPAERVFDDLHALFEAEHPDVLLDLSTHPGSVEISMTALTHGVRPVIGATGWTAAEREVIARLADERGIGAMLVPNFSVGATLAMRFAAEAARYFPTAEIVEMHHDGKKDRPSGTARLTADRMREAGYGGEVAIHSVRLRGVVAHQETLFGGEGELLTIRHDSFSRESFVPGMLACARSVVRLSGLHVGLEGALEILRG